MKSLEQERIFITVQGDNVRDEIQIRSGFEFCQTEISVIAAIRACQNSSRCQKLSRMTYLKSAALLLAFVLAGCTSLKTTRSTAPHVELTLQKVAFQLGETKIHAQSRQFGTGKLTMVNVHDDEQESVDAAVIILEKRGGRLVELTHSGKRRVVFPLDGNEYSFDPNRIFSKAGVRLTVRNETNRDAKVPENAHLAVDQFAAQFIRYFKLDQSPAFITLHNNGDGGLSIHTYEPGGDWAADTDELHVSSTIDPDEFYFVTDKRIYDHLKKRDANVILQDNSIKRDDGSLSVFAGRHGIRYINVEAQPEHFEEQIRMIEIAVEVMGDK